MIHEIIAVFSKSRDMKIVLVVIGHARALLVRALKDGDASQELLNPRKLRHQ